MSYKVLKIKPLNKGGTVATLEKLNKAEKKAHYKEAEFGLLFQAWDGASAATNMDL